MIENKLTLGEAIKKYQSGSQIYTFLKSKKTYLFITGDKYVLKNGEVALYLSFQELDTLFGNENYFVDENIEEVVDLQKDEEYYSWKQ